MESDESKKFAYDLIHDAIVLTCYEEERRIKHKAEYHPFLFIEVILNATNDKELLRIYYGVHGFDRVEELDAEGKDIFLAIMGHYYDAIKETPKS